MTVKKSSIRFYPGVGLICGAVMALQILQSRIFSVVTWYHLSFLTISIAMFGLTLGALDVYRGDKEKQRKNLGKLLGVLTLRFGLFAIAALAVQLCVPIVDKSFATILFTLPLVAGVTAACYYQAGKIVSLCLTRSAYPVGRVYAADMTGAALGCLAAIGLMKLVDAPSAVIMLSGGIIACGFLFHRPKKQALRAALAVAVALLGLANALTPERPVYPRWIKGFDLPRSEISFEAWNPISRVTVSPQIEQIPAYLWGASPKLPAGTKTEYQYLRVDGAAGTPIMRFEGKSWSKMKFLEYDLTNLAHFIPGINSFAIIGVGGGRDLLSALYFGAKRVVALDINDAQIRLLKDIPAYRDYSNLWQHPGVDIVNSEARSWLTQNNETFDAIQMSMIDTWVSSAAGAYALTENSLYTVDAWKVFLSRLNDRGVFTVSRWHKTDGACNDLCRLAAITSQALLEMGEKKPAQHVFIAHVDRIVTFIVGRHPLTDVQLNALHAEAKKFGYTVLASPRQPPSDPNLKRILKAASPKGIDAAIRNLPFDVSPVTDARPFFFNQARIWKPWEVIRQAREGNMFTQNLHGHAVATVNLYAIILLAIIASVLVLVLPFRGALKKAPKKFLYAGTAYFALIGLGFMFVEITLMQMMSMFLGHPVYGLGVVLFSLILSCGIGSLETERRKLLLKTPAQIVIWALLLAAYLALMAVAVGPMMHDFIAKDFMTRLMLCVFMIFPAGILMGFGFPSGVKLTENKSDALTPWFWGINGAFGVVASALAMVISIGFGLPFTILAGALCYAALAWPGTVLAQASRK